MQGGNNCGFRIDGRAEEHPRHSGDVSENVRPNGAVNNTGDEFIANSAPGGADNFQNYYDGGYNRIFTSRMLRGGILKWITAWTTQG